MRFQLILQTLDDEPLVAELDASRRGRREDYPQRAMWNSLIAGIVFQHPTIASLRRELLRNGELRQACGFDPLRGAAAVPSKDAYHRFGLKLIALQERLDGLFDALVERLRGLLKDFGRRLAADGKAIGSWRKSDPEAAVGFKTQGQPDGTPGQTVTTHWHGYKLHMLCDATHELPVAFDVTAANVHESPRLMALMERVRQRHPQLLARARTLAADRGFDDGADKKALYEDYGVAPVIPARDLNQGAMQPLDEQRSDTIYVSPTGEVCCKIAPFAANETQRFAAMQFMGYEAARATLKFRCPAAAYGLECKNRDTCAGSWRAKHGAYGRVVRVALDKDRRLFGPIYAHSYRFEDEYKHRTSAERLFYRFDHMYGFERHAILGLKRMRARVTLALIAMQATAVGWIEAGQAENLRRLRPAA